MIDLRRLHHALAIAREGSLSAAAESIPLSPSALSRSLRTLELEYGITIFERGKSGAALTPEGIRFMAHVELLLRRAEFTERQLRRSTTAVTPVSFGIGSTTASAYLPEVIRHFREVDPLPLIVHTGSNRALLKLLQDGELNFYVGGIPQVEDIYFRTNSFRVRRIRGHSAELLVRPGHPLVTAPDRCTLSEFDTVSGTFSSDTVAAEALARLGLRQPALQVDNYEILADFVRTGDTILVATGALRRRRPDLGLTVLGEPLDLAPEGYGLVVAADPPVTAEARRVADYIVDLVDDAG